jgi:hypothetical protein
VRTRHRGLPAVWVCACCLGVPAATNAQSVVRGPYLQLGTPDGVIVRWRTDVSTDSRVLYGDAPGNLLQAVNDPTSGTDHEVALTGLDPGTAYYYAVGTSTAVLAGADVDHLFVTAPGTGSVQPVRIWVLGDSGTADANAAAVRDAYLGFNAGARTDLVLMLGDNAYDDGTDAEYQAAVFDMYPSVLRQTVLWPTFGNHDGVSADSDTLTGPYYDVFTLPRSGEAGGSPSGTEAYYSFDYANIHFVCLDSHDSDRTPTGPMLTWLGDDLAATDQTWIVAFWHHPPYSKGSHDSDSEARLVQMRENALPVLEAHGVDLVLGGHSHSYERSFLLAGHYGASGTLDPSMVLDGGDGREDGDGAYLQNPDGAVFMVAGSSGKTTPASLNHPAMYLSLLELGSLVLDVDGDRLDVSFVSDTGVVEDYLTLLQPVSSLIFDDDFESGDTSAWSSVSGGGP